jgi:hypothetical protein
MNPSCPYGSDYPISPIDYCPASSASPSSGLRYDASRKDQSLSPIRSQLSTGGASVSSEAACKIIEFNLVHLQADRSQLLRLLTARTGARPELLEGEGEVDRRQPTRAEPAVEQHRIPAKGCLCPRRRVRIECGKTVRMGSPA